MPKRGLYQSLTKNTVTFHKLANGRYGLLAWYPQVKAAKVAKGNGRSTVTATEELAEPDEEIVSDPVEAAGVTSDGDIAVPKHPQ